MSRYKTRFQVRTVWPADGNRARGCAYVVHDMSRTKWLREVFRDGSRSQCARVAELLNGVHEAAPVAAALAKETKVRAGGCEVCGTAPAQPCDQCGTRVCQDHSAQFGGDGADHLLCCDCNERDLKFTREQERRERRYNEDGRE